MKTIPAPLKYGIVIASALVALICLVGLLVPGMIPDDQRASIWETFAGVTVAAILCAVLVPTTK